MPPAVYYDPDDPDIRQSAEDELRARRELIGNAWLYYRGDMQKHLKFDKKTQDDNITVNLCKQLVDRVVSFRVPKFPELELDELKDTDAEKELRKIWTRNGGPLKLAKIVKNGALAGHCFVRVMPPKPGSDYQRIINLNPANVIVFWRGDDYEEVLWYQIQWTLGKTAYRQDIVAMNNQTWQIREYQGSIEKSVGGEKITWVFSKSEDWNYPLAPIMDWQHGLNSDAYYGDGELGHARLNDKVNKVKSDVSRILRFHASPRTIGTGMEATEVTPTAIENFWTIDDADAKVYNLEMKSDLASSHNFAEDLTQHFYAEGRVVVLKGTIADFQRVTNLGIRALYIDQLAKNEELGWQYATGIQGVSQRVRMLLGVPDYQAPVIVKWADPLPKDSKEEREALAIEQGMGTVSKQTIAKDLDRNWTLELEQMDEESQDEGSLMNRVLTTADPTKRNSGMIE
jgi:hypothetical protein